MAVNFSSIGATARDFATITLWEAATDIDLTVATGTGNNEVGECYDDANFDEHVVISGATTETANHRILHAAIGEGHVGLRSTAKVTVKPTTPGHVFSIQEKFSESGSGMLIELGISAAASDECFRVGSTSEPAQATLIENAILWNTSIAGSIDGVYAGNYDVGGIGANPITVRNCFINGMTRAGVNAQQFSTSGNKDHFWNLINLTITDCDTGIGWTAGKFNSDMVLVIVNVIVGDSGTNDFVDMHATGSPGVLNTTGSANNWDELNEIPGKFADSPMVLLTAEGGGGSECLITSKSPYNILLIDSGDNDVLLDGVGNGSNSLVPRSDFIGNDRGSGATCDPGCHQVSAVPGGGVSGTIDAQASPASTSIAGDVERSGSIDAQAAPASTAIVGDVEHSGSVDAQAAPASASATGDVERSGSIDAQASPASASVTGNTSLDGSIDAQAAPASASVVGDVERSGSVDAQAGPASTSVAGDVERAGTISAVSGPASASVTGNTTAALEGTIDAQASPASASVVGDVERAGSIDARARFATTSVTGDVERTGTIGAAASPASTTITGDVERSGSISAGAGAATTQITGTLGTGLTGEGSTAKTFIQTFDSTFTKLRVRIRKLGGGTIVVPVDAHSVVIRRLV